MFAPENKGEDIPEGYQLIRDQHAFHIRLWWGWQDHFRETIQAAQIPQVTLDFAESWDEWTPVLSVRA